MEVFEAAFSPEDLRRLLDLSQLLDHTKIAPSSSIVPPIEVKPWVNLVANCKLASVDPRKKVNRKTFVTLDDEDAIREFVKMHNNTDIYMTPWAYYSTKKPTSSKSSIVGGYKMEGDFWIELEGSKNEDKIKEQAAQTGHKVIAILERDFGIRRLSVYYNGGKSLYIRVSAFYFISGPVVRLCDDYQLVMKYIRDQLPEELRSRIDHTLYDVSQILRMPGTIYPNGGAMVEIPPTMLGNPNWHKQVADITGPADGELDPFFLPRPPDDETMKSRDLFKKITNATRFKDFRAGKKHQKEKNDIIRQYLAANSAKMAPCIMRMVGAISSSHSLGFYGRCKLIYEASQAGMSEDKICGLFLMNEDPDRYGVIEPDQNPKPDTCGYRLVSKYKASMFSDSGCDKPDVSPYCEVFACYRASLNIQVKAEMFGEGDPTVQEFQEQARLQLTEFLND